MAFALAELGRPLERSGRWLSCTRVITVDGELWCDEEIPARLSDLCEVVDGEADPKLRGGDAVRRGPVCEYGRMPPRAIEILEQPVDINRASLGELATLPGVGPVTAAKIREGRPYRVPGDLLRVKGIGETRLRKMASRVLSSPTPTRFR